MGVGALPRDAQRTTMKLYALALAAVLSVAASACGQTKPVGYDVAACSPTAFRAVHVELSDTALTATMVSPGPGEVVVLPKPVVYKYDHKEKDGARYYVAENGAMIAIEKSDDKGLIGVVLAKDGEMVAVVFGVVDQDGSKLAENAASEFNGCVDLFKEENPNDNKS